MRARSASHGRAALRREQEMPYGLRTFLADLHSAGAAVDFAAQYPGGRLVDAPLHGCWTCFTTVLAVLVLIVFVAWIFSC